MKKNIVLLKIKNFKTNKTFNKSHFSYNYIILIIINKGHLSKRIKILQILFFRFYFYQIITQ